MSIESNTNTGLDQLGDLLSSYPPETWLAQIAHYDYSDLQGKGFDDARKLGKEKWHLYVTLRPFVLRAIAHYAIRLANPSNCHPQSAPSTEDLHKARQLYIESEKLIIERINQSKKTSDLYVILAPFLSEQSTGGPDQFVPHNVIARSSLLYAPYEMQISDAIGLSLKKVHRCMLAVFCYVRDYARYVFDIDGIFLANKGRIDREDFKRFLDYFSADCKSYQEYCNNSIGERPSRHEFNALNRFPIFRTVDGDYCVPFSQWLLEAPTRQLFHVILNSFSNQAERKNFLDSFGGVFENYVTDLFLSTPLRFVSCDSMPGLSGERAEFYVSSGTKVLVVECKVHLFRRDTFVSASSSEIKSHLSKQLPKALKQVRNTMNHLDAKWKYGLIVSDQSVPLANTSMFRREFDVPRNVFVASCDEVEMLTGLSPSAFFKTFKDLGGKASNSEGTFFSVIPVSESLNPMLEKEFQRVVRELIP